MISALSVRARYILIAALAVAAGIIALSAPYMSSAKSMVMGKLGLSHGSMLADASCTLPKDASDDIYFVSCAGFF
jgi:hypothetical protein